MPWLDDKVCEPSLRGQGLKKMYESIVDRELSHSRNYLTLYKAAQKAGQADLAKMAKGYITDSIARINHTEKWVFGKRRFDPNDDSGGSSEYDDKVSEAIATLRKAIL